MYPYPRKDADDDDRTVLDVRGVRPGHRPPVDVAMLDEPTSEVPVIRPSRAGATDPAERAADAGGSAEETVALDATGSDQGRDPAPAAGGQRDSGSPEITDPEPTTVLTTSAWPPATPPGSAATAVTDAAPATPVGGGGDPDDLEPDDTGPGASLTTGTEPSAAGSTTGSSGAEPSGSTSSAPGPSGTGRGTYPYDSPRETAVQTSDASHLLAPAAPAPASPPPVTSPFGPGPAGAGQPASETDEVARTASNDLAGAQLADDSDSVDSAESADTPDAAYALDDDLDDDAVDGAGADPGEVADVSPGGNGSRAPGEVIETPIAIWSDETAGQLREQWREVQAQFIDDPAAAVEGAKALVTDAVRQLADTLLETQAGLDPFRDGDAVDTEAMRVAMRRYREFLDRVLAL